MLLGLVGYVNVLIRLNAEHLGLVIKHTVHYPVSKRFCHYEFHVFFWNIQFLSNVRKVDVGIGEGNLSEADTDDDLVEAKDQGIESILLVGWLVVLYETVKAV
jgi:hypothetical protein